MHRNLEASTVFVANPSNATLQQGEFEPLKRATILLVDDEAGILEVCREALSNYAARILCAGNGEAALAILARENVDLVISDVRMPTLGGVGLLRQARAAGVTADFIMLTGYGSIENAVECSRLGAFNYLVKPFRLDQLLDAVLEAVTHRREKATKEAVSAATPALNVAASPQDFHVEESPAIYSCGRIAAEPVIPAASMSSGPPGALRRPAGQDNDAVADMLGLADALSQNAQPRELLREFLVRVRDAFQPDGVVLAFAAPGVEGLSDVTIAGALFREDAELKQRMTSAGHLLLSHSLPARIDGEDFLALAGLAPGSSLGLRYRPISGLLSPIRGGVQEHLGAVLALRRVCGEASVDPSTGALRPAVPCRQYQERDLQMLRLFSSQLGLRLHSRRQSRTITSLSQEIIYSYVAAVEAKDAYTSGHSSRVSAYAARLGKVMGLPAVDQDRLRIAGYLHDIGKIGAPDAILNKPGPLTSDEMAVMRQHPVVGRTILSKISSFKDILPIVYHHHERYDGQGYPEGLGGTDIPLLARIVCVVDSFEAMLSERAYKRARSVDEVRDILSSCAGTQWDPEVVAAWLHILDDRQIDPTGRPYDLV